MIVQNKNRMLKRLLVFCLLGNLQLSAQLLPSIGLVTQPLNSATLCNQPFYTGSFYNTGYQRGNTVPDFKLYKLNGDSLVLSQALLGGKQILLIAGSLTCPVFRAKVNTINQVASTYSNAIDIYVVYTLEAHPTDTSVYFGYVNVTSQNNSAGILFPQPKTYAARKAMVDTMSAWVNLQVPVLIDGPCDQWWTNFGPAPNNSYLIGTNGVVRSKHGWFHKSPDNIYCDLDSLLNINSGLCTNANTPPGQFTVNVINDQVSGNPGDLLYDYLQLINTSSLTCNIKIKKLQKDLPASWETAFCADICYGIADDSVQLAMEPYDTLLFSLDFFTGALPDTGSVKVGMKNTGKSNNSFVFTLRASTLQNNLSLNKLTAANSLLPFPNPANSTVLFPFVNEGDLVRIINTQGLSVFDGTGVKQVDVHDWPPGLYFGVINGNVPFKIIVER